MDLKQKERLPAGIWGTSGTFGNTRGNKKVDMERLANETELYQNNGHQRVKV